MTPNEKLIFSRIKECFAFRLNQLDWNMIMNYLQSISRFDNSICFNNPQIPDLLIRSIKDTTNGHVVRYIYFLNKPWEMHDQGSITEADRESWKIFIQFLKDFFSEDKKQLWISSVTNCYSNDPKKSIVKPPKSVNRAIPGKTPPHTISINFIN